MSSLWRMRTFDPEAEFSVVERRLPHWSQAGTVCFITWRTADSMPASVVRRWFADREAWLRRHGIDPHAPDWRTRLEAELDPKLTSEFVRHFSERWHRQLDACHGTCVFRNPALANIIAESLLHFDGERYDLTDFVIMPNHVHLLAAFADEAGMLSQCESWKHFTATKINRALGRGGTLWQQDGFDHLVRSSEQFEALRRYIAANPRKARLKVGEYVHFSKDLASKGK